jgi:formylglycine-generating enzyme required for sulfatase activity
VRQLVSGRTLVDRYDALIAEGGFTTPVGSYPGGRSSYGCMDMAGNACEWTSSLVTASNGVEAGQIVNAVRGGSWYSGASSCRATARGEGRSATGAYHSVGFRIAASARS